MLPKGLLKEYSKTLSMIVRGMDILAILMAGVLAYGCKIGNFFLPLNYTFALSIAAVMAMIIFSFSRIYESQRTQSLWQTFSRLIQSIFILLFFLAGLAFFTKTGESFSRGWFILWGAFSFVLLCLFRFGILIILRLMRTHGLNERRVIIIGAGRLGQKLAESVQHSLWTGFRIIVFLDDFPNEKNTTIANIPIEMMPKNLSDYLKNSKDSIDEIWLALPLSAENRVKKLLFELRHHTISIRFVLDIFGLDLLSHSISDLAGFPMLNLNASPMVGVNRMVKALEDRIIAFFILIFISPILLGIAISVKLTSKGPVLFKQLRHGWDGRIIKVYKFRTMYVHQETHGKVTQATQNDKRITRLGKFLRRTSLDELPQFFNVLQGRMSIVGPRPHAIEHNEFYKDSIKAYMQRHKVKPGITGWAQVNGWRGETDHLGKMEKRVEYDLFYIENWSLGLDLKIIFLTIFQGFFHKNAY
jgi:putative colanic acid biosynthesis UDP-glucose lipid carrier transferase